MDGHPRIRPATVDDAGAVADIYAPIVARTAISFEVDPPPAAEMARRIVETTARLPWLVADAGGVIAGYAYASPHRSRAAYRWAVDVSVYIHDAWRGRGVGRLVYRRLVTELVNLGYVAAYAGIALPNAASVALHEALGFEPIGVYPAVGFKLGAWHDVGWWRLALAEPPAHPTDPLVWQPVPEA